MAGAFFAIIFLLEKKYQLQASQIEPLKPAKNRQKGRFGSHHRKKKKNNAIKKELVGIDLFQITTAFLRCLPGYFVKIRHGRNYSIWISCETIAKQAML
ncbi:MAG: hypothetical protein GX589_04845 [Deltaproteobacteria bacterium]|nr:hypothetical protein [Deltaproteobacteria bacterium]